MLEVETAKAEAKIPVKIHVVAEGESLLSYKTASELLVQILNSVSENFHGNWKNEFRSVFNRVGKMKDKAIKLLIDPDVRPVVSSRSEVVTRSCSDVSSRGTNFAGTLFIPNLRLKWNGMIQMKCPFHH